MMCRRAVWHSDIRRPPSSGAKWREVVSAAAVMVSHVKGLARLHSSAESHRDPAGGKAPNWFWNAMACRGLLNCSRPKSVPLQKSQVHVYLRLLRICASPPPLPAGGGGVGDTIVHRMIDKPDLEDNRKIFKHGEGITSYGRVARGHVAAIEFSDQCYHALLLGSDRRR